MQIVEDLSRPPRPNERAVITIGAYDGVHVGHQAVIDQVRQEAAARGAWSAVVTFDRHPASVVRPESAPQLLTDAAQRIELLGATRVDATVVVPFNEAQAAESAEAFVQRVLVDCLRTEAIVVGEDFHFGRGRDGNVDLLRKVGNHGPVGTGFDVVPLDLVPRTDGVDEPVSSTAIRRALAGGDITRANEMLGRRFEVRGVVSEGDRRGRLLGFPTANVIVPGQICLPADGVYAGWFERADGSAHRCAINLGRRPTFYEHADSSLLEAHLLDFDADLYGESVKVRFAHFMRSERKFDGVDALVVQLRSDIDQARTLLALG